MFTCERCGGQFSAGAVAVVGLPHPALCPRCRILLRRLGERNLARQDRNRKIFWERVVLALMLAAAAVCLWGEWKRTEPFQWKEPAEPLHVDPQPGDDATEELPRVPGTSAAVMSLDFFLRR